jgi:SAM-dependent methyltransferase
MSGQRSGAAEAYDRFAPIYDEFTLCNDYEVWLGEVLLPVLEEHGLRVGRALDVGCGTGRAFEPLLKRGWEVLGIDVSEEMLSRAEDAYGARVTVMRCDARELPLSSEPFDLILALNDMVNYLTEDGDLERAFVGMKKNLAPLGLVCFDANTLALFESDWTAGRSGPMNERGWKWRGQTEDPKAGGHFAAELAGEGVETHVHQERHWERDAVEAAMRAAGLRCIAALGQREDGRTILLETPPDEELHAKTIYIGSHSE